MNKLILKTLLVVILLVLVFAVALVNCKKVTRQTQFKTIEYTGCNNKTELSDDYREAINQTDTLVASIKDDLLKLTVGVNYICCSTFKATQTIDGNNITLSITETTASPDLYCRCTCYYTFDFYYTDIVYDSYVVKVIFDSLDDTKDKSSTTTINIKKS